MECPVLVSIIEHKQLCQVLVAVAVILCTCIIILKRCCMSNTASHTEKTQTKAEKSKQISSPYNRPNKRKEENLGGKEERQDTASTSLQMQTTFEYQTVAESWKQIQFHHDGPKKEKADSLIDEWDGREEAKRKILIGRLLNYTEDDREGLKQLIKKGFKLEVSKEEADVVHNMYATYLDKYLQQLSNEDVDIVTIAHAELIVTHITTDGRNLYRSTHETHAEIVLIERTEPQDVHTIWIENSPCTDCSKELVEHFKQESKKPTICMGKLYEKDKDGNGIKLLMKSGFTLQPWEKYIEYAGWNVEDSPITKKINELTNDQAST